MSIPCPHALNNLRLSLLLVAAVLSGCAREPDNAADVVYSGGDILSMAGDQPQYVEALAVKNGKISFIGTQAEADKLIGKATLEVNLQGATVIPAIVSSGMVPAMNFEADSQAPNCWTGMSPATSRAVIQALDITLKNRKAFGADSIFCNGFDPAAFGNSPALTEADLSEAFSRNPVVLIQAGGTGILSNNSAKERFSLDTYKVLKGAMLQESGGLRVGQSADFMLLDKNPLKVNSELLSVIQITQAFVGGKLIADAPKNLSMLTSLDVNAALVHEKSILAEIEGQRAIEAAKKTAAAAAAAKKTPIVTKKVNAETKTKPATASAAEKQQPQRSNEKKPLASKPAAVETPALEEAPKPKEVRFNMTQDGKKMTPEDFDAWMKAQGIRIVPAKPVEAAPADVKRDGG